MHKQEQQTVTAQLQLDHEKDLPFLSGDLDATLRLIEKSLGISASFRGSKVMFQGAPDTVQRAVGLVRDIRDLRSEGLQLHLDDLRSFLDSMRTNDALTLRELYRENISVSRKKRLITPKNTTQREYLQAIRDYDMVFGIGPAGTGKTYLAMAMAINALLARKVSRVVLARPAVEAGEKLGFLPGDMIEKVNPYLRPLYDALYDMMEMDKAHRLIERGEIEIAPLAFMRGRTLNDSFIILDEAQNTTPEQMKMYLTRLGFNSKTVITGDVTQIDLPQGRASGLVVAERVLTGVEGVKVVYFRGGDVVRHKLVQDIVGAYDRYERAQEEKGKPEA